jgi:hypothetical protein
VERYCAEEAPEMTCCVILKGQSVTCSIRVSSRAFEQILRNVRKRESLKFFVFDTQQWCESHPPPNKSLKSVLMSTS